jgi:hypothetical protein
MSITDLAWMVVFLACSFAGCSLLICWVIDHESRRRENRDA